MVRTHVNIDRSKMLRPFVLKLRCQVQLPNLQPLTSFMFNETELYASMRDSNVNISREKIYINKEKQQH